MLERWQSELKRTGFGKRLGNFQESYQTQGKGYGAKEKLQFKNDCW